MMKDKMLEQIEEISKRDGAFVEYYNTLFEIINGMEGNDRAIVLYSLLNSVRDSGISEGRKSFKSDIKGLLHSL